MTMLTIAVGTGRTSKEAIAILQKAGIFFPEYEAKTRKLVLMDETKKIKLILVKNADLTTYVERGAADIGFTGKDMILEQTPDVYEVLDLKIGRCKIAVAGFPNTFKHHKAVTVATKYPVITKQYFKEQQVRVETIALSGSIELAPLLGLSDVIVDIVETGTTLKENGLVILEEIREISTRCIVNKASFATKTVEVEQFIENIQKGLG